RISDVLLKKDILLSFPYHHFHPMIDLLRESAMDPEVRTIQITVYRMAQNSKIANALINAARNGKIVTVMLELQARFDEENNLDWKERFETEGVRVLLGIPNKKVHAKLCIVKKRVGNKTLQYGFVSTGNINEKTAKIYGDHCLMTSDRTIMADINKIFSALAGAKNGEFSPKPIKNMLVCPITMRETINNHIDNEIQEALAGRKAYMVIKVNSLSDTDIIQKLYQAAEAGVKIEMIVRGIYCAMNQKKFKEQIHAISIVDEYLEHARVMYFHAAGKEYVYISSADWMTRNLDHRVEAAVRINSKKIKNEITDMLALQLKDNVKARILDNNLENTYVPADGSELRSQVEIARYLRAKAKHD
ncbi:MAG: phospholipase D-like domain-containing protein, partial [Sphingobacterium sp.]